MKQVRKILPALAILAFLCVFCTLLTAAADTITVSSETDLQNAVTTLAKTGGTIRFAGDISTSGAVTLPVNRARITIDGGGYTLGMHGSLTLNGDMDFTNILFYNERNTWTTGDYISVFCGGHDVHFWDTVACSKAGLAYPSIMTGYAGNAAFTGGSLTIDGGTWQRVRGGNAGTGAVLQIGSVVINGGSITEFLQICGAGACAPGSRFDVTVNGGSIRNIRFFSTSATADADTVLTVNGGEVAGRILLSTNQSGILNGDCTIRLLHGDFSGLTGIYDHAGGGSLKASLLLSPSLAEVTENRVTDTLSGTLLRTGVADPCLLYTGGLYYLTMTGSSNIALIRSSTLEGLANQTLGDNLVYRGAQDTTAINTFGYTTLSGTWSPELHCFSADDFGADYAGWYMFLALRKQGNDSSNIRMVALKSSGSDTPDGPYVHPIDGTQYKSQPILDKDGNIITEWGCGMSILRIESGEYKGIYAMWVAEENRGTADFFQKIMIARLKSPWQLASEPTVILTPTQYWETIGSGYNGTKYYPAVVEGATALYGKDGQVYIIYCGSGYWTNYGLGQITWNGGDPQSASSWVKYTDNPIFGANDKNGRHYTGVMMQGAGHAFFLHDAEDRLYAVYHAYPSAANGSGKASARNAYIEPCTIDYSLYNGTNYGVLTFGNGKKPADTSTQVSFTTYLSHASLFDRLDASLLADITLADTAELTAEVKNGSVALNVTYNTDATGCEIRRKAEDGTFTLLAKLTDGETRYIDKTVKCNIEYTYIAVSYVDYGGTRYYGTPSDTATASVRLEPPTLKVRVSADSGTAFLTISHPSAASIDYYCIYKYDAAAGAGTKTLLAKIKANYNSLADQAIEYAHTYVYLVTALQGSSESAPSAEVSVYIPTPRMTFTAATAVGGGILLTVTDRENADSYEFKRSDASGSTTVLANTKDTTFLDTDVVPGTRYSYTVTAYEDGAPASRITANCTAAAPKASLSITEKDGTVNIRIPAVSGAVSFALYRDGALLLSGKPGASSQFPNPWGDGKFVFRLDVLDKDGNVFDSVTQTLRIGAPYDEAYDKNGDGVCDIRDVLLLLQSVLNGNGGTLADVVKLLRFIAD